MKIGLVGFAGSGKTTVFNTMTGLDVPVGFGGEVRLGTVRVPDARIDALSKIFSPKKTTYAEMSFCDIPGEHGADKKGLSAKRCSRSATRRRSAWCCATSTTRRSRRRPIRCATWKRSISSACSPIWSIVERRLERAKKEKLSEARAGRVRADEGDARRRTAAALAVRGASSIARRSKATASSRDRPLLVALNRSEERAAEPLPSEIWPRASPRWTRPGSRSPPAWRPRSPRWSPTSRPRFWRTWGSASRRSRASSAPPTGCST